MSSKLKQQLELMKLGEHNRNRRTYIPISLIPRIEGIIQASHSELGDFLERDTFMTIRNTWEQGKEIPIIFDNERIQKRLQEIADEMKDYAKKEVIIIDSLANMMPSERR